MAGPALAAPGQVEENGAQRRRSTAAAPRDGPAARLRRSGRRTKGAPPRSAHTWGPPAGGARPAAEGKARAGPSRAAPGGRLPVRRGPLRRAAIANPGPRGAPPPSGLRGAHGPWREAASGAALPSDPPCRGKLPCGARPTSP